MLAEHHNEMLEEVRGLVRIEPTEPVPYTYELSVRSQQLHILGGFPEALLPSEARLIRNLLARIEKDFQTPGENAFLLVVCTNAVHMVCGRLLEKEAVEL